MFDWLNNWILKILKSWIKDLEEQEPIPKKIKSDNVYHDYPWGKYGTLNSILGRNKDTEEQK